MRVRDHEELHRDHDTEPQTKYERHAPPRTATHRRTRFGTPRTATISSNNERVHQITKDKTVGLYLKDKA